MTVAVENLTKRFGDTVAVDGMDLVAEEGELTTLLGPSGCGKTTTLRSVAGLERPDSGRIRIGDRVVADVSEGLFIPIQQRDIGFVFQTFKIWPHMTVFENVAYPLRLRDVPKDEIQERVLDTLKLTNMQEQIDQPAVTLSGGQQARVGLCRALVYEPEVLLCDEPLTGLDRSLRKELRSEIRRIQTELGITTIYVTHSQLEAMSMSDKLCLMNTDGYIEQSGTPEEMYQGPESLYAFEFLGDSQTFDGEVVGDGTVRTDIGDIQCETAGHSSGDEVIVGFRPDEVVISNDPTTDETSNTWSGTVINPYYYGEFYDIDIRLDGTIIQVRVDEDEYLDQEYSGEVTINVPTHQIEVFKQG